MAVVAISRQYGAGGWAVGQILAERLKYQLVDQAILDKVARDAKIPLQSVQEAERVAGDSMLSFFTELAASLPFVRHAPGVSSDFDENKYRLFLKRSITELAGRGSAIIVGRGCQMILKDHPEALRFFIVSSDDDRIKNLMARYGYDQKKAETVAYREEKRRIAFLRGFGTGDPDDPLMYHLIINTSEVGDQMAADIIYTMIHAKETGKKIK